MAAPEAVRQRIETALHGVAVTDEPGGTFTVFPPHEQAIVDVLRLCRETRTPVVPVGGRTMLAVGSPPPAGAIFLSVGRVNQLVEHDDANLTVTTGSGMTVRALQHTLARRGQFVALDPPAPELATVGGVVAVNINGFRRVGYRSIRDIVIGLRVATGEGEIVKAGGKVVKNVAGYDMCKLFVGSLGTLGIITEITARVEPLPEADVTLVVSGTPAAVASAVAAVAASSLLPTAAVLVNAKTAGRLLGAPGPALLVRLEGFAATVPRQEREVRALARGAVDRLDGEPHMKVWAAAQRLGWEGQTGLVRLMVPGSRVLDVWAALPPTVEAAADVLSGTIWVGLNGVENPAQEMAAISASAERAGGHFLIARLPESAANVPRWGPIPETLALMRGLKQSFDPDGILNPGRFLV